MRYRGSKNKVFSRYNAAIVLVFTLIVFSALSVGYSQYFRQINAYEQQALVELADQASRLNAMLEQNLHALTGMQKFANNALNFPEQQAITLPKFSQDGKLFYLDKPRQTQMGVRENLHGNITGLGQVASFDLLEQQELAMANALTTAFISAKMTLPEATWFYYISFNQFVNIYPWIDRDNWHYSDKMLQNEQIKRIGQSQLSTSDFVWSPPYVDSAGKGLNASLSIGVYRQEQVVGALVVDINLESIRNHLPDFSHDKHGLVLLNREHRVLVYKHLGKVKLSPAASWQDLLPMPLNQLTIEKLLQLPGSTQIDGWLLQKSQLPINDWVLLKYQPYYSFAAPVFNRFILIFMALFLVLVAFLSLVYFLTRSTFIKPATEFISHIENCAQGDPGKIKPTADWLHWFKIVEDIFGQNRSLLQQLKEQNMVLDRRVGEKTQELMKSSEQHQRDYALLGSVMNAMPELIIFNDPKGLLIGCNKAFEDFIDKNKTDLLGFSVSELMPAVLGNALLELSALSNQDLVNVAHQRVVENDEHTYEVFSTQFFNDVGVSLGTINIFRDVTDQYAIQSALKSAKNQAEYASQAKSQFLANMSHEIRTPINAIQGMMALLKQTALNSHQNHYLANAQRASTSLLHLIDELLDLSKIEAGKMFITKAMANLDLIVDKALKLNAGMAYSHDLRLVVNIAADVPAIVMTDEMRLVQVLSNLLNNAVKFTHSGEIRLIVEVIAGGERNVLVRFKVADTGIGIAKDKQIHLFDAFSQADDSMTREYGGSGLGLSICQQIVNLLGGEITLRSDLGKGSEFSFVLPLPLPKPDRPIEKVFKNIIIVALSIDCSESLALAIAMYGGKLYPIVSLTEIQQLPMDKKVILLVEGEYLSSTEENYFTYIADDLAEKVILLGVCQPTMVNLASQVSEGLNQLNIPYLSLDMPLYRYALGEIISALSVDDALNGSEGAEQKVIEPLANLAGVNILLVEDNLVNQLVAKELLSNMQAQVTIAENGQMAIDILEKEMFDVVLMDIQMPIMDGLTATRLLRSQPKYAQIPIIAMTAHARDEDKQNSLAAGMNMHIAKPVSAEILLESISSIVQVN